MSKSTWDKQLLLKRDRKIKTTFNQLFNKKRLRIDDVIFQLKWEHFFLSEQTIKRVLKEKGMKHPPVSNEFKPHPEGLSLVEARNKSLEARFNHLFNEKRLRWDDVIETLSSKEYFVKKATIEKLINKIN